MAWIELERSGVYHVAFRFGGQKFKKSLKTRDQGEADARCRLLEGAIRRVEAGTLKIPGDVDVCAYLLSDGQLNGKPTAPKRLTLGNLFAAYRDSLPTDSLEPESLRVAEIHMRHFSRILSSRRDIRAVGPEDLQHYVTTRSGEPGKRGRVSVGTIKKELGTLSSVWTWASNHGYVSGPFPKNGLRYPKLDEKPPFQTWAQIIRQIESAGLSQAEEEELWDCLYFDGAELEQLLNHAESSARYAFLYPMMLVAAHTGARRSELCRSRVGDFDFHAESIRIRERKRVRGQRTTRLVPMTTKVRDVIESWFATKPRSLFTFPEDHQVARIRKDRPEEGCVTPDEASYHLQQLLAGSKWENVRGWHIFRHSFISMCAVKGVDQRMIDAWVGHQTEAMRRRYTHFFPNSQQEAIARVFQGC